MTGEIAGALTTALAITALIISIIAYRTVKKEDRKRKRVALLSIIFATVAVVFALIYIIREFGG